MLLMYRQLYFTPSIMRNGRIILRNYILKHRQSKGTFSGLLLLWATWCAALKLHSLLYIFEPLREKQSFPVPRQQKECLEGNTYYLESKSERPYWDLHRKSGGARSAFVRDHSVLAGLSQWKSCMSSHETGRNHHKSLVKHQGPSTGTLYTSFPS